MQYKDGYVKLAVSLTEFRENSKWLHHQLRLALMIHKRFLPLQVLPSPVYPDLQEQVYDSGVSVQIALLAQLWVLLTHSSSSKAQIRRLIQHIR